MPILRTSYAGVSDYSEATPLGVVTFFRVNHHSTINDGMATMYEYTPAQGSNAGLVTSWRAFPYVVPMLMQPGGARPKPSSVEDPEGSS
jgi:hypothetical protein